MTQAEVTAVPSAPTAPFGTVAAPAMVVVTTEGGEFGTPTLQPTDVLPLHPFAHALHYGSACFEGLKAHRGIDGAVRLFRSGDHAQRLVASAARMMLPIPPPDLVYSMIMMAVRANLSAVPAAPGSLYIRPVLIGTEANIGAAAAPSTEAMLYVVASPVGDYFTSGARPLRVLIETTHPRTTPQFGRVKAGANYAMALQPTLAARRDRAADQVLFAPGGDVQETGASNFLLLDDQRVVTKGLDDTFLHGITRDSVLVLAHDAGLVVEERTIDVDELSSWAAEGEAALTGTAAVIAGVGTFIVGDDEIAVRAVNDPSARGMGPVARALRESLIRIQTGADADPYGWTELVDKDL